MGRQVNFYMTESDEADFLSFARCSPAIRIFPFHNRSHEPDYMEQLPSYTSDFGYVVFLAHMDLTPRIELKSVPSQDFYVPDTYRAEVIEFSRSGVRAGTLRPGRLWVETRYWDSSVEPPVLREKSTDFVTWYERLARWIKKSGKHYELSFYLLPGAARFLAEGGKLGA